MKKLFYIIILCFFICCKPSTEQTKTSEDYTYLEYSKNSLDYSVTPKNAFDKSGLMFSDQGAWFAFSFPDSTSLSSGFTGPFLMTQQNGVWKNSLVPYYAYSKDSIFVLNNNLEQNAYSSHLEQKKFNSEIGITEKMVFLNGNTALTKYEVKNLSNTEQELNIGWNTSGQFNNSFSYTVNNNTLEIHSNRSLAKGYIILPKNIKWHKTDSISFTSHYKRGKLKPNESVSFVISQTFIFPEYSWEDEQKLIASVNFDSVLESRKSEKDKQLKTLIGKRKLQFQDSIYANTLAKALLTLQNNWRIPAGEIKHEGLFPSYHYKWFNGFWSWDSWKHAVGLSHYDTRLAKEQIKLMFKFQNDDGFVADCVYRNTLIEAHNYRDTKPPLSAWAVAKIHEKDNDLEFVQYMYPKLKKYHYWWYNKRDHDQDGICEYGSTDGSLIAAKWESGMDNAIRFDDSKILKNDEGAYSINQESVDLNAYLYAEKLFLADLARALNLEEDATQYIAEAKNLKTRIQTQFYDPEDGWFYDTTLNGASFIKGEGSEGWTALWAKAATPKQAEAVKTKMMDTSKFYTAVPFQTMSADHPKFDPLKGYWRGPNWLDQAYFGVKGLRNYGYNNDADRATVQILKGAEGLLKKGQPIRENYHPLTGKGLHAKNFSWSAAHVIMLLVNE